MCHATFIRTRLSVAQYATLMEPGTRIDPFFFYIQLVADTHARFHWRMPNSAPDPGLRLFDLTRFWSSRFVYSISVF